MIIGIPKSPFRENALSCGRLVTKERVSIPSRGARETWAMRAAILLIVIAGIAAYFNSLHVPFLFDDLDSIAANPSIRRLWPLWPVLSPPRSAVTVEGRPVVNLSLAINYAIAGLDVVPYHVFNLGVHVLASLTLFGIAHRTLRLPKFANRFAGSATGLALAIALIWQLHPLQTMSVTYVIQRAESLMGLFYLMTLYCVILGAQSARARFWHLAAVVCCALGMGSKEVMVSAPLTVLLYERTFLAQSFGEILRARSRLYTGLMSTWAFLVAGVLTSHGRLDDTGFHFVDLSPLSYAMTQCEYVVRYIGLAFWPSPLILDYGLADAGVPIIRTLPAWAPWGAVILALSAGTLAALRYRPWIGFLGSWFFVILGPTSSFLSMPTEVVAEHRMYLALVPVVVLPLMLGCLMGERLVCWATASKGKRRLLGRSLSALLVVPLVVTLGYLTHRRNQDYRTVVSILEDTIRKRPGNPRPRTNLGAELAATGDLPRARDELSKAIELKPDYAAAYNNRGSVYDAMGSYEEALTDLNRAIELAPGYTDAYNNRGSANFNKGRYVEAERDYTKSLELKPGDPDVYFSRGNSYAYRKMYARAVRDYTSAIRLKPDYGAAYHNRCIAYSGMTRYPEAIEDCTTAIGLMPNPAEAYSSRAIAWFNLGDREKAREDVRSCRESGGTPSPSLIRQLTEATSRSK